MREYKGYQLCRLGSQCQARECRWRIQWMGWATTSDAESGRSGNLGIIYSQEYKKASSINSKYYLKAEVSPFTKADPYATAAEKRPKTASLVYDVSQASVERFDLDGSAEDWRSAEKTTFDL